MGEEEEEEGWGRGYRRPVAELRLSEAQVCDRQTDRRMISGFTFESG